MTGSNPAPAPRVAWIVAAILLALLSSALSIGASQLDNPWRLVFGLLALIGTVGAGASLGMWTAAHRRERARRNVQRPQ